MALTNEVTLGLHLGAGASDGYLVSAENVLDETKEQTVQATLDDMYDKSEVDAKIAASGTFDSSQYYTKTEVDAKDEAILNPITITEGSGSVNINSSKTIGLYNVGLIIPTAEYDITTSDGIINIPSNLAVEWNVTIGRGSLTIGSTTIDEAILSALKTIADKINAGYSVVFVANS